ncbi:MAG: prolyl oligopeptidase family serine peptidase [Longimicrobiales bacterium]|nr:prolyl oligopeptidase family serine peptidase [Longimicrobiales bacterium]
MIRFCHRSLWTLAVLFVLTLPSSSACQTSAQMEPEVARSFDFPLTIESIMRGPELVGVAPGGIQWSNDSDWIFFRWAPGGGAWDDNPELYRVRSSGGDPEKVPEEMADSVALFTASGDLSRDGSRRVASVEGDLYLLETRPFNARRLTETGEGESSPIFSVDEESIFFTKGGNVFEMSLDRVMLRQLTDIRSGPEPVDAPEATGQKAFLEAQQEKLFEYIRRLKESRAERETDQEAAAAKGQPQPTYLAAGERAGNPIPNVTGTYAMLSTSRTAQGAQPTNVPNWITESGYTEELNGRTKVGDGQGSSRLGLLAIATGKITWLDLYPLDDEEGSGEEEEGVEEEEGGVTESGAELGFASFAGWNDAGTHGLIVSSSFDREWNWVFSVEASTGELSLLDSLHDEAWVGGPCSRCVGWLPDSDRAYFVSEATGYSHLYTVSADGSERSQLTEGDWEVLNIQILEDGERFLLHTSEGSPFNQHVYTMRFDGSRRTAITSGPGSFSATPSPDGERLAIVHSRANRPEELFLANFEPGARLDRITLSPTEEWLTFSWQEPEIIHFPARDGVQVPARIYRPSDLGAEPNGAAVIFVHGAGYLHNVHNYWSSYSREYMFNHFLAANGYTVLDIDYRGSAGYGRDWRTGIFRWMGGKDLSDHTDGAGYLVREEGIDADRIGLYGGSYGGFITLMALFTEPDVFTSGAALRSVTDWAHYNHGYTSNILNLPQDDAEAYEKSSPIYFAENFRGHLLIAHGMVDTNVHFSDVVRLTQRLIELGKENWEMAVYPVENHGFVQPSSWTDEYRRIFELFERTISRPGCTDDGGLCPVRGSGN